jgi:triosephosphate isomerase
MNKTLGEARAYALEIVKWASTSGLAATLCIFPPFTSLAAVCESVHTHRRDTDTSGTTLDSTFAIATSHIHVGAQNMHWADKGSFTGEISPPMLLDCGADFVELGHLERRGEFGETDESINKKMHAALTHGLTPLVCVGEDEDDQEYGVSAEVVRRQVKIALHGVPENRIRGIIIAYEPGWAIGDAGRGADPEYVATMSTHIRNALQEQYGRRVAQDIRIVYGGSVTPDNAAGFASRTDLNGLFVGRAGWDAASFIRIVEAFCGATRDKVHSRSPSLQRPLER